MTTWKRSKPRPRKNRPAPSRRLEGSFASQRLDLRHLVASIGQRILRFVEAHNEPRPLLPCPDRPRGRRIGGVEAQHVTFLLFDLAGKRHHLRRYERAEIALVRDPAVDHAVRPRA